MAKKQLSPIIGEISDAATFGADGEITGSTVFVTADGQHLTRDEAFPRRLGAGGTQGHGRRLAESPSSPSSFIRTIKASMSMLMFLGELAFGLRSPGQLSEALATEERAIDRCEPSGELWIAAELLRLNGEFLLLQGAAGAAAAADDRFRQAVDWARRQGALSRELRAVTSLARCGAIRAVPRRRWRSSSQSMTASLRGSTRLT
jgi:hypothetical protein